MGKMIMPRYVAPPATCILIFKISSQEKEICYRSYQCYLKNQENGNSFIDNEIIHDVGEPSSESSVMQSSALSASTVDISNKDSSLKFHISGENTMKKFMEKSVQTDEIKFLPEVTIEKQKRNLYEEIKEDKKLTFILVHLIMNYFHGFYPCFMKRFSSPENSVKKSIY